MSDDEGHVLVVEDEEAVADLYATWLEDHYQVEVANDGSEALDRLDDGVNVVLLDRRMPGLSGDEVLTRIRDRGLACRVAMVTAVDPDFDIVDMGFDDYLVKPVTADELLGVVDGLLGRLTYTEQVREYFAVASKVAALESAKPESELAEDDRYQELAGRLATLESEVDTSLHDHDDFVGAFRDIPDPPDHPSPVGEPRK